MSASLGRPVRLSSVEVRLLPWPGFVLTNLTVEEDPAYGAEPVLHANTVIASIRLLSLWRGRLEIGSISVDEASLNLVRTAGRPLEPGFALSHGSRAGSAGRPAARPARRVARCPTLRPPTPASTSRTARRSCRFHWSTTDLSFWQQEPGDWRIRLRGQPARTDLSLDLADTGMVRLEASVRQCARAAADAGAPRSGLARGATGPAHAAGHRLRSRLARRPDRRSCIWTAPPRRPRSRPGCAPPASTAPSLPPPRRWTSTPSCGLVYHYSSRSVENLVCDSPLGDGHIHLAGDLPGERQRRRISPWSWTGFRWPPAWMRCAPSAAALAPAWRPEARSAARSPTRKPRRAARVRDQPRKDRARQDASGARRGLSPAASRWRDFN